MNLNVSARAGPLLDENHISIRPNIPSPVLDIIQPKIEFKVLNILVIIAAGRDMHFDHTAPRITRLDEIQVSVTDSEITVGCIRGLERAYAMEIDGPIVVSSAGDVHFNHARSSALGFDEVEITVVDGERAIASFGGSKGSWGLNGPHGVLRSTGQTVNLNLMGLA